MRTGKSKAAIYLLLGVLALLALNWFADKSAVRIDLTQDKKYSLTTATRALIAQQENPIFVEVLLTGEFPAGFKRLANATSEMLETFRRINPEIVFQFRDPLAGSPEDANKYLEELAAVGILPTELSVRSRDGSSKKQIYPYAIFNYADRQVAINLLEQEAGGKSAEETLNLAISLLEFKFSNAIAKLRAEQKPNLVFTTGHGELNELQTASLENRLNAFYNTGRIHLDSIYQIPTSIDLVMVAKPLTSFTDKEVFVLDQYLVNGGNIIFLIDPLLVSLDSIQQSGRYIPHDIDLGLDDAFFKYGFRIQRNLVLDLECSSIPLVAGGTRENPQYQMFNWFYHPLALGRENHPITKGIDRVNLFFPAGIDTIRTKTLIEKSILLESSQYSRSQQSPVILDFNILREEPDPNRFDSGKQMLALLLEGQFTSAFENRVSSQFRAALESIGTSFRSVGEAGKILVVADGDLAKNSYDVRSGAPRPLGFNPYMKYTFGNADFLVNSIEYMLDRNGLIEARARHIQLRLLNRQRIEEEKTWWQMVNLVFPVILVILAGLIYTWMRRRRYAH